jgi:hypothetical protein
MTERRFIDPMTTSVREERIIINFAKKLLAGSDRAANGTFFRLGVITFARSLVDFNKLPEDLVTEYKAIISEDKNYLEELLTERIISDQKAALDQAYQSKTPDVNSITESAKPEIDKYSLKAEKLEVHDYGDDSRKIITKEQYLNDPNAYRIIPKVENQEDQS